MIIGCDVSHYQNSQEIPDNAAFVWIKATEGSNYKDPKMNDHLVYIAQTRPDNLPIIGFYHFARAKSNSPEIEVENFTGRIGTHIGQCLCALDIEDNSLDLNSTKLSGWIDRFVSIFYEKTHVIPFLYMSESYIPRVIDKINPAIPIWVAKYSTSKPAKNYNTRYPKMWQFTSCPIDLDIWQGSAFELAKMGIPD